jgi:hypothetical protein
VAPGAPQAPYEGAIGEILPSVDVLGDDCLNVNVWAPERAEPGSLPVLLWFHGGALVRGAAPPPPPAGAPNPARRPSGGLTLLGPSADTDSTMKSARSLPSTVLVLIR